MLNIIVICGKVYLRQKDVQQNTLLFRHNRTYRYQSSAGVSFYEIFLQERIVIK